MLETTTLGQTGLEVSRLCLGGGSYGGSVKEEQAIEQLDHFRSLGGNFLDTAVIYCDWFEGERSSSQNIIGRYLRSRGCRQQMVLSVKGCNGKILAPTNDLGTAPRSPFRLHRADIIEDIELSMKNLRTDYLDIFTLHHDDEAVDVAEIFETLQEQKKRGVIRAYGCSNWRIERQEKALAYAKTHGLDGFAVDQINWSLNRFAPGANIGPDPVMDPQAYRFHRESRIPVMAYGANGRGYFHCRANGLPIRPQDHPQYDCAENDELLAVLKAAAEDAGAEVNTLVIHYLLLDHGFQTIPIVGIKTLRELDICAAALSYTMPEQVQDQLRALRGLDR